MAAITTFDIPELLESILLNLRPMEIFKAKVVARQWKEVIESSICLKQVMFLATDGLIQPQKNENGSITMDPTSFNPTMQTQPFKHVPLFTFRPGSPFKPKGTWVYRVNESTDSSPSKAIHGFQWKPKMKNWTKIPSVFRSMYLTQPAVTALSIHVDGTEKMLATIYDKEGITLGLIADTFKKMFNQLERGEQKTVKNSRYGMLAVFLMPKIT